MDLHQNARLTFRSREALAKKIMVEGRQPKNCRQVRCCAAIGKTQQASRKNAHTQTLMRYIGSP